MTSTPKRLTDAQIEFIKAHRKKKSVRQLAKELGLQRTDVLSAIASGDKSPLIETRLAGKYTLPLSLILIFILTFFTFSNTLGHQFVWDDWQFVVQDKNLENVQNLPKEIVKPLGYYGTESAQDQGSLWRPVVTASFFWDTFLWSKNRPGGYHLTNVLLHCLTAVLFFLFLRRFIRSVPLAFFAALFYALHPVQSEAVSSVNGRGSPFSGVFVLLAFLAYPRRVWLSALMLALALYSKETAVTFFMAVVAYDVLIRKENILSVKTVLKNYGLLLSVTVVYFFTRFLVIGGLGKASTGADVSGYFTLPSRFWAQPLYFWEYLKMIFFPVGLHMKRQLYFPKSFFEPEYFFAFLGFSALLYFGWLSYKTDKRAFFGFLWFIVFLIPVLNFFVIINGTVMEHWLYLPLMGLVLCLAVWIEAPLASSRRLRVWALGMGTIILAVFMWMTFNQNKIWKDNLTLFEYLTRYVTRDPTVYNELGVASAEKGLTDRAEKAFNRSLELDPKNADAAFNLNLLKTRKKENFVSGSPGADEGSYFDSLPVSGLLEIFYDDMDRLDTEDVPDLKENTLNGKKSYTFHDKRVEDLDKNELVKLVEQCARLISQKTADEQNQTLAVRRR